MKLKLLSRLMDAISPGIIAIPAAIQANGADLDLSAFAAMAQANALNSQSSAGGVNFSASAGATITLTNLGNLLQQLTNGGATTVTLDSAYNICNALPKPLFVGEAFTFNIQTNAGTTVATPTLSDTAVTLAGTTSVLAAAMRWYQGAITQVNTTVGSLLTAGSTFTSLTQVGSTNNYTVALGTNAITPTVGNLFYIGTTAGTLPAGWYPINKVTSATSFVIAAPVSAAAWTCTAATLNSTGVAPSTYSPMITITGLMATVTAIMSV